MQAMLKLQQQIDLRIEKVQDWLDGITARERIMVITAAIFVLVSSIAAALFYMHQAADDQQKRLQQLNDTVAWMQTHASSMKAPDEMQLSSLEKIQRAAQQQGLSVTSQPSGEQMLIQTSHANYVMLANFLTQIAQMGLTIEKLELNEADGQIKLSAAVF